jgi:hypothetical protein
MSGYTTGPWCDDTGSAIGARAVVGDGQQLAALVYGRTRDEQVANARLISAAPDLLEALKTCVAVMDSDEMLGVWSFLHANRYQWTGPVADMNQARAAIAKAEGQTSEASGSPAPSVRSGDE